MRLRNLFGSHTSSRRSCSTAGARRCGRTTRRLAVEALEQRTLLSVGPVAEFSATVQPNDPATLEASAMVAATAPEGEVVHGPLRVGVWTEELIGNLGDWVENQTWPDVFGHGAVGRGDVWEYFHQRLLSDPRGGYQTIMRIDVAPTVDSQQAADALEELDFVIFAKLDNESPPRYSPGLQKALDGITAGNSQEPVYGGPAEVVPTPAQPDAWDDPASPEVAEPEGEVVHGPLRVGVWTEELIGNLGDWVENQTWPDVFGHGAVGRGDIWEYFHQRLLSDLRGGYQTIMRIDVAETVDSQQAADALEELDFVIFAKLDSESPLRYSPGTQKALDGITTGDAPGYTRLHGEDTWGHGDRASTEFRVTWRTPAKVTDVQDFVKREGWPEALGPISTVNVQLLLSQRMLQDARGGYLNTARIRVFGDVTALDQVSFLEHVRLESKSPQWGPGVQEALDAITTGNSPERVYGGPAEVVSRGYDGSDQADDGTPDTFELRRRPGGIEVKINGRVVETIAAEDLDRIIINGSGDDDTIKVYNLGEFTGTIELNGGAGTDTVRIWDTPGSDVLLSHPNSATMTMEDAYDVTAVDFRYIHAYSTAGGNDVAELYDSAGDDLFVATAQGSNKRGQLSGADHYCRAKLFDEVHAYADNGGNDVAKLYDSPGDDLFYVTERNLATTHFGTLSGPGFSYRAQYFDKVHAYSTAGGNDKAKMYDSSGDDRFRATGREGDRHAVLLNKNAGFYYRAKFFDEVRAYGSGGYDRADLHDSSGDDRFLGKPTFGRLSGEGFFYQAKNFDGVYAHATAGGDDRADLYDSPGDDTFQGTPDYAKLYGLGFYNKARNFERAYALGLPAVWLVKLSNLSVCRREWPLSSDCGFTG